MSKPASKAFLAALNKRQPFASRASAGQQRHEVMIIVAWSCLGMGDGQREHVRRGEVTADLGLDVIPDPTFTREEMQVITYAAKKQALKCLRDRKRAQRNAAARREAATWTGKP